jgi:hypothetical protein
VLFRVISLFQLIPWNHFGRKNVGFLYAIAHGAKVICSAVQCSAVQCSAVQCSAVQCSAVQCSAVQCSAGNLRHRRRQHPPGDQPAPPLANDRPDLNRENGEQLVAVSLTDYLLVLFAIYLLFAIFTVQVNIYRQFTEQRVWPRGFPLEQLHGEEPIVCCRSLLSHSLS